jgi:hypothetical protein
MKWVCLRRASDGHQSRSPHDAASNPAPARGILASVYCSPPGCDHRRLSRSLAPTVFPISKNANKDCSEKNFLWGENNRPKLSRFRNKFIQSARVNMNEAVFADIMTGMELALTVAAENRFLEAKVLL